MGEERIWRYTRNERISAVAVSSPHTILNPLEEYDLPFFVHQTDTDNPTSELIKKINAEGEVDPTEYTQAFLMRRVQIGIRFIYPELSDAEIMGFISEFFDKQDPEYEGYIKRLFLSLRLDEVIHESGILSEYIKYQERQIPLSTHY